MAGCRLLIRSNSEASEAVERVKVRCWGRGRGVVRGGSRDVVGWETGGGRLWGEWVIGLGWVRGDGGSHGRGGIWRVLRIWLRSRSSGHHRSRVSWTWGRMAEDVVDGDPRREGIALRRLDWIAENIDSGLRERSRNSSGLGGWRLLLEKNTPEDVHCRSCLCGLGLAEGGGEDTRGGWWRRGKSDESWCRLCGGRRSGGLRRRRRGGWLRQRRGSWRRGEDVEQVNTGRGGGWRLADLLCREHGLQESLGDWELSFSRLDAGVELDEQSGVIIQLEHRLDILPRERERWEKRGGEREQQTCPVPAPSSLSMAVPREDCWIRSCAATSSAMSSDLSSWLDRAARMTSLRIIIEDWQPATTSATGDWVTDGMWTASSLGGAREEGGVWWKGVRVLLVADWVCVWPEEEGAKGCEGRRVFCAGAPPLLSLILSAKAAASSASIKVLGDSKNAPPPPSRE
jgi:hypothetical protein